MRDIFLVLLILGVILLSVFLVWSQQKETTDNINPNQIDSMKETHLALTSSAFVDGGSIPSKYTCDAGPNPSGGQGIIPPLMISGVPDEAVSLVLVMDDPDIPDSVKEAREIEVFDHWITFNMSADTTTIEEGKQPAGTSGINSAGNVGYAGPCPPDGEHRYFFKLYALDALLNLSEGATKAEVEDAMEGHIVAETQLIGRYERQ